MKITKVILLLIVIFCTVSCQVPNRESEIIDRRTEKNMVGRENSKFILDKTKKLETEDLNHLETNGLKLYFDDADVLIRAEVTNKNYRTKSGVKIGDPKEKVMKIYGKPLSEERKINKGAVQIGKVTGLFYDEIVFFTHDNRVNGILYGKY